MSADNVAFPAFAAARRAGARLLLTTGHAGPSAANPQQPPNETDGQADRCTHDSCTDRARHTIPAEPTIRKITCRTTPICNEKQLQAPFGHSQNARTHGPK